MIAAYPIAGLLLLGAAIVWIRPQWISTLNSLPPEKVRNVDLPKVRRIASGGLTLLAVVIGGGSWLLLQSGISEMMLTVLGIIVVFLGAITIVALVEMQNHNK